MSTTPNLNCISFTYVEPNDKNGPEFIQVHYVEDEADVFKNGPTVAFQLKPQPPVSNGIFTLVFNPDYYPLNIFCDGNRVSIMIQAENGEIALLVPFDKLEETVITVFSISGANAPGEVRINIDDTKSESEIGIVIVGTSGLSVSGT